MKKYILKKSILSAYFVIVSIIFIPLTFVPMNMDPFPSYFIIDLCYILAIASICFLLPMVYQEMFHILTLLFEFLVLIVSASLYLSRGDIFSWGILDQAVQLTTVASAVKVPKFALIFGIILIIGYIPLCIFIKKPKIELRNFYKLMTVCITSGILLLASGINVILHIVIRNNFDEDDYFRSDSFAYCSFNLTRDSLQKFGYYGFYFESFFRFMIPSFNPKIKNVGEPYVYENYTSVLNNLCKDDNILMFYAESFDIYGISKELTPVLYSLKNGINLSENGILDYYNVSNENGKTILSRKDFDYNTNTKKYTYNETDIYSNTQINQVGLELSKHFSNESTNLSEIASLTSFPTITDYSITLPKILNDDYSTNYIHGNYSSYYFRDEYISNEVGFENTKFYEDVKDVTRGSKDVLNCFAFDSDIMNHYVNNQDEFNCFPTDEKFFTYFMTITTHCFYEYNELLENNYALIDAVSGSEICDKTFNLYNSLEPELKNTMKEYFARVLDTEHTLALAVNYLYEKDLLDDTIIILSGDHIPTTNNILSFKNLYIKEVLGLTPELYKNTVESFIYSTKITSEYLSSQNENRKIENITEPVDFVPTILTLIGKDFNKEQCLGTAVINKSVTNPEKTITSSLYHSFSYDRVESINLYTYNGRDIISKAPTYTPTQTELDNFIKEYNQAFKKYYYILEQRSNA